MNCDRHRLYFAFLSKKICLFFLYYYINLCCIAFDGLNGNSRCNFLRAMTYLISLIFDDSPSFHAKIIKEKKYYLHNVSLVSLYISRRNFLAAMYTRIYLASLIFDLSVKLIVLFQKKEKN